MGSAKSQEFSGLFAPLRTQEWEVVQEMRTHEVWTRRRDNANFMAFTVNAAAVESQQRLQLYNFRRLNRGSVVAVESILVAEQDSLCVLPAGRVVIIENMPLTLATLHHSLGFPQAMTVLSAAFAGYATLNYVYGPLFTDETMIGITENGRPKVWINPNFASNQPSPFAMNGGDGQPTSLEQRTYCCVQRIFDVIQHSLTGNYPIDFREEATQVTSFAEGEEFVENYCRQRGIFIDDRVYLNVLNKIEPLVFKTETHLLTERISLNTYPLPTSVNTRAIPLSETNHDAYAFLPSQQGPFYQPSCFQPSSFSQVSITQRPLLRSTVSGNTRVNFVFSTAANSLLTENSPIIPITIQKQNDSAEVQPTQIQIEPSRQEESLFVSGHSGKQEKKIEVTITPLPPANEHPQINTVESREEIQLHFVPANHEESEQQYQLMVHQIDQNQEQEEPQHQDQVDQSPQQANPLAPPQQVIIIQPISQPPSLQNNIEVNRIPTSQSMQEGIVRSLQSQYRQSEAYDELKKWEESLIKLSAKQSKQQSHNRIKSGDISDSAEQYLSEERDQVHIEDPPVRQIHLFNTESELQAYVRNKYKGYFEPQQTQEQQIIIEQPAQDNNDYDAIRQSGIQSTSHFNQGSQVYQTQELVSQPQLPKGQSSKFSSWEEFDQRKYTFGKIEIDPISAKQQYTKALEKESAAPSRRSKLMGSIELNTFEDRYSKYVKNKESRSRFYSRDVSTILKADDSLNRIDSVAQEYLRESTNTNHIRSTSSRARQKKDGLTYDKLRELLWA